MLYLTICNPVDGSMQDSSVHGILQARILEWVAISFSRGASWPRDQTHVSCTGRCFTTEPPGQVVHIWLTSRKLPNCVPERQYTFLSYQTCMRVQLFHIHINTCYLSFLFFLSHPFKHWVDHKVHSHFSILSYETWMNFLANPIYILVSHHFSFAFS